MMGAGGSAFSDAGCGAILKLLEISKEIEDFQSILQVEAMPELKSSLDF